MSEKIREQLRPIRQRQRWAAVLTVMVWGLFVGGACALVLSVLRSSGVAVEPAWVLAALAAGLGLGAALGLLRKSSWNQAAEAVDAHYHLKDRVISALQFSQRDFQGEQASLCELQVADTLRRIEGVDAGEVCVLRLPRVLPVALVFSILAVALLLFSFNSGTVVAKPAQTLAHIQDEANFLEDTMLDELRELLEEQQQQPELEKLVDELEELVEEMGEPGVDEREALAKLSEMQLAIAALQAEFDLEAMDAHMKSLGDALGDAKATQATADALAEGEYKQAADQLEQLDPDQIARKEAKGLSKKLSKLAQSFSDQGQQQLSEATAEMAEGLETSDGKKCEGGACKLAGLCRKQGLRKSISECLGCQLGRLSECKGNCSGGSAQGKKNGGNNVARSDRPSNNWGRGASGNPFGEEATQLDGARNRFNISGQHGEGPSEKETIHSPEAREQAQRGYREAYREYRKMAEAVTESEALPLGHRQIIRRYFEAIRPDNAAADEGQQ